MDKVVTDALAIVTAEVKARDRDRYLSVLYAPEAARAGMMAVHGLDLEMAQIVASTSEPMLGEIRLAWWRDALIALDSGVVPAHPLLQLLANEVLARGVAGADLAELEDRWLGLIDCDDVPVAHIGGGGTLFALLARLGGGDTSGARRLGEAWVAGEPPEVPVAPALRPLLGLVQLAVRDAARARAGHGREPRGSTLRQLRLLTSVAFGR
jgi:phytoene synthase